jgi:hypothetical protein
MSKHIILIVLAICQFHLAHGQANNNVNSKWTKKEAKEYTNHYYSTQEADLIYRIKRVRRKESNTFIVTIKSCDLVTTPCKGPFLRTKSKHQLIIEEGGKYQYSLPLKH